MNCGGSSAIPTEMVEQDLASRTVFMYRCRSAARRLHSGIGRGPTTDSSEGLDGEAAWRPVLPGAGVELCSMPVTSICVIFFSFTLVDTHSMRPGWWRAHRSKEPSIYEALG